MPIEKIRGCGYRKVHARYLCGEGIAVPCDMLPLEIAECDCCGYIIPFTRALMFINKQYIKTRIDIVQAEICNKTQGKKPTFHEQDCTCIKNYGKCPLYKVNEHYKQYTLEELRQMKGYEV